MTDRATRSRPVGRQLLALAALRDHAPPHFHARYGGHEATVRIRDGLVTGKFPPRPLGLVLEWYIRHREELAENWERARHGKPLRSIDPLE